MRTRRLAILRGALGCVAMGSVFVVVGGTPFAVTLEPLSSPHASRKKSAKHY